MSVTPIIMAATVATTMTQPVNSAGPAMFMGLGLIGVCIFAAIMMSGDFNKSEKPALIFMAVWLVVSFVISINI